jgi:hypothetical protein
MASAAEQFTHTQSRGAERERWRELEQKKTSLILKPSKTCERFMAMPALAWPESRAKN